MRIRRIRDEQGMPIEDLKPGDDVHKAVAGLYEYKRAYPNGRPHDYSYQARERTPHSQPPQPHPDEYAATFRPARNSNVSPAPDESQCQFVSEKVASHNDAGGWVRGQGNQSPYPNFDNNDGVVSGARYSGTRYRK
jgi:hypothetical protein